VQKDATNSRRKLRGISDKILRRDRAKRFFAPTTLPTSHKKATRTRRHKLDQTNNAIKQQTTNKFALKRDLIIGNDCVVSPIRASREAAFSHHLAGSNPQPRGDWHG
jgi:hypothetical protein